MDPIAIIGDVHGDAGALQRLVSKAELSDRLLVFVGDLVNRGSDSRRVVELAMALQARRRTVFIKGNHEIAFLRYLKDGRFVPFAMMGGLTTIRSYVGVARGNVHQQFRSAVPSSHVAFLASGVGYWESENILVTHAGVPPEHPRTRRRAILADGRYPSLFKGKWRGPTFLVCGHYVQDSGVPFLRGRFACVDTGCGTNGGPLTALVLPECTFVQSR